MKTGLIFLFALLLCIPFTISAQWTDNGTNIRTNDAVGIGSSSDLYSFYTRTNRAGWQGRFANRENGIGADVYLAHGAGYGMHIRGRTVDGKYTLQLYNLEKQTNVFYNNGRVGLGLVGNVGIGTNSPSHKLTVMGETYINGGWVRVAGNKGIYFQTHGGGFYMLDNTWIRTYGNKSFYHRTGIMRTDGILQVGPAGNRFTVRTNGNVGVGVTVPQFKLDVCGHIRAKEVRVQTGWCDYVFEEGYNQPTLEEEEQYIKEKGHLSGFQSEAEMEGEVKLADVTVRQQEKIEQMMLHLIEINKRLETVEAENTLLKQQLEEK